jgi:1-aminocyclopropane-1-carboxylate deaminase/D-cysteine desulfhydrase-like pyridoxal-dependent ACC family enzyme
MEEINLELKDIIEMIRRYVATHKDVAFLWSFVAFKKDPEHKCVDCGDNCDIIDEKSSRLGAFGYLPILREMSNEIRDEIENECDENGFVNF